MAAVLTPPRTVRSAPLFPPQHGAWAFLGLPVVVGWTVTSWTPLLVLLAAAWIAVYPASYFVLAIVAENSRRHPRPRRFARPLVTWATIAVAAAAPVLWARPWLVWVALGYLVAFGVNLAFARRRDDRALANDAVFIVECAAMVAVTWAVGVGDGGWVPPWPWPTPVWILVLAVAVLLTGSTMHVKALIRERSDPRYARAARLVALGSVPLAVGAAWWWGLPGGAWLVVPFAYFAVRSLVVTSPRRPGVLGMVELAGFVLLAVAAALA